MERGNRVAWLVLTYGRDRAKAEAVRDLGAFVRRIRRRLGHEAAYAATYELTAAGRLHINVLVLDWSHIRKRTLQSWWGHNLWVKQVRTEDTIGKEMAADYSPESLGGYLSKLSQAVPAEWKRRVSYSLNWPKFDPPARLPGVKFSLEEWPRERDVAKGLLVPTAHNVYRQRITKPCECFAEWEGNKDAVPNTGSFSQNLVEIPQGHSTSTDP